MKRAIALAVGNARSDRGGPFGAVVAKDGQVVAEGVNLVTATNDPTAHAEIVAIRAACRQLGSFQLAGCELYASCEPCPMCLGAIYWARPARVYFGALASDAAAAGFDDSLIYSQFAVEPAGRRIPCLSLLREDALEAFDEWRRNAGRVPY